MIGYLKGELIYAEEGVAVLDVNGVGYEINCSGAAYRDIINNRGGEVYIYTAVKEDGISLYGFNTKDEKKLFLKLISVSGVGPKMGIAVLSALTVDDLTLKIATGDVKGLSGVKGLGKKTAERIILELRDKVGAVETEGVPVSSDEVTSGETDDAVAALMSLGFTKTESVQAVKKAKVAGATTIEQAITFALKSMR